MAELGRYSVEVGGIADELLEYLNGDNAKRVLDSIGLDGLANMSSQDRDAAVKLLSQSPSARHKAIERMIKKLAGLEYYTALLNARYVAVMGARLIAAADRFEMVPGMSYRRAAGVSAEEALRMRAITKSDILPSQYRGYHYQDDDEDDEDGDY